MAGNTRVEEGWLREGTELWGGRVVVGPSGLVFEPRCRAGTRAEHKQRITSPVCTYARAHITRAQADTPRAHTPGLSIRGAGSAGGSCEAFTVGANELTKRPLPSKQGASKVSLQVPPMCSVHL
jgi:hypothetical protein